ncbi:Nucleoside-triphosphatase rdgB [Haliscomenobacter hydrossis DSM 1100]|uniref:dITP/XTP pyrophosphatase n=2 Tax=Haliscomenobacter TaxID=2349 RepID=F4KRH8_HALH1|nr:non-canonical purine NTP diphosphatase [Haliscomenobacter hydrossis]AEE47968.1 Nucleoside-triphosphatase rdgB [Haliscomenobacter hydrossis DSM 1100]
MKTLIFASSNPNKIKEVREMLDGLFEVKGLLDIGCTKDIPETADTIEGNALLKARYVVENYGLNCFSEDTGLEVFALKGAPGVHSARYSGEGRDPQANIDLLQQNLAPHADRSARFKTVIALILDGKEHLFEGLVYGQIRKEQHGSGGFGYDPVFVPDGYALSFAEMDKTEKNRISHRGRAVQKLLDFLKEG